MVVSPLPSDDGAPRHVSPVHRPLTPLTEAVDPSRLLVTYLAALAALIACMAISLSATFLQTGEYLYDADNINVSGRQRMLSQRILLFAERGSEGSFSEDERAAMGGAIDLFEASHRHLSSHPDLAPAIAALYVDGPEGHALDDRIATFVDAARRSLAQPGDGAALSTLRAIERGGLLRDLDAVVAAFETASGDRIRHLRAVGQYSLLAAVGFVLAQLAFVFLPGHRAIRAKIAALKARSSELSDMRDYLAHAYDDLADRNQSLQAARAQVAHALAESEGLRQEQAEFTYALSHDLKAPANTMALLLSELRVETCDTLDPEARELLDAAQGTLRRMTGLIEDVLAYSAASGAASGPVVERVDMAGLFRDVIDDLSSEIRASGAEVAWDTAETVAGYPNQLRILVQNLVANAIKFCRPGVPPRVRLACRRAGEVWTLVVQDNGIGIPDEQRARIFGLFQRLHVHADYPGTGLGLATCQRVAANHRGRIDVVSTPGSGSTFTVTLRPPDPKSASDPRAAAA